MIEIIKAESDQLEISMTAPVTDADYTKVLAPAIDAAIERADRVRVLILLEAGMSDFTFGAMLDDARLGLKHWSGFDRIAVVTDQKGLGRTIRAFSLLYPCPVMVFPKAEVDDARRWLRESLGAIHQTDLGDGVLHLALHGKIDASVYAEEVQDLDAFIRRSERFRLLLDIRDFDGWQGLGAVLEHLKLVRGHVPLVDRVAIVGDGGWKKLAAEMGRRLIGAEARSFDAEEFDAAQAWLKT